MTAEFFPHHPSQKRRKWGTRVSPVNSGGGDREVTQVSGAYWPASPNQQAQAAVKHHLKSYPAPEEGVPASVHTGTRMCLSTQLYTCTHNKIKSGASRADGIQTGRAGL